MPVQSRGSEQADVTEPCSDSNILDYRASTSLHCSQMVTGDGVHLLQLAVRSFVRSFVRELITRGIIQRVARTCSGVKSGSSSAARCRTVKLYWRARDEAEGKLAIASSRLSCEFKSNRRYIRAQATCSHAFTRSRSRSAIASSASIAGSYVRASQIPLHAGAIHSKLEPIRRSVV